MTVEEIQNLANLLRHRDPSFVREGEALAVTLPLFAVREDEVVADALLQEVFEGDEIMWIQFAWLAHNHPHLVIVEDLEFATPWVLLPDCWDLLNGVDKALEISIDMPNLLELPKSLLHCEAVDTIYLRSDSIRSLGQEWSALDIRFASEDLFEQDFDSETFDDFRYSDDAVLELFVDYTKSKRNWSGDWINERHCKTLWESTNASNGSYGDSGSFEVIYQIGTQGYAHLSGSWAYIDSMHPPGFGDCSLDNQVFGSEAQEYLYQVLMAHDPTAEELESYPHHIQKLTWSLGTPASLNSRLNQAIVNAGAKEQYRQTMLDGIQALEDRLQQLKSEWQNW